MRRGYDVVVTIDADGQHDPRDVPRLVEELGATGADVVGSRDAQARSYSGPLGRRIGQATFSLLTRLLNGTAHLRYHVWSEGDASKRLPCRAQSAVPGLRIRVTGRGWRAFVPHLPLDIVATGVSIRRRSRRDLSPRVRPERRYEGVRARFSPRLQVQAIASNVQRLFALFFREQGAITGIALVLLVLLWRGYQRPFASGGWALELTGFAAFGLYGLVNAEGRYLAPFVVLLWAGLWITVRLRPEAGHPGWLRASGLAFILAVAVNIGTFHLDGFNALVRVVPVERAGPVSGSAAPDARPSVMAAGLLDLGLARGDSIGVIGNAIGATWARLARLRIVADVAPEDVNAFWSGSPDQQRAVLEAFNGAGVRAVIAEPPPAGTVPEEWSRVGQTIYLARLMRGGAGSRGNLAPRP